MDLRIISRRVVAVVTTVTAVAAGAPAGAAAVEPACSLGRLVQRVALIAPQPRSFYSVDALNPDVVHLGRRWLMYFSGNSVRSSAAPRWVTGLAVASSPTGPFHVTAYRGDYLNGGTAVWRGRLWHLVERRPGVESALEVSDDGLHWREVALLPNFVVGGQPAAGADFSLTVEDGQLDAFMFLVHPPPIGSLYALGHVFFDGHRFHGFQVVLRRDPTVATEAYDVGEPDVFSLGARQLMLYGSTSAALVRSVSLAVHEHAGWVRCGAVIRGGASWAPEIAVDPSAVADGRSLYVYYGGSSGNGLVADLGGHIGVDVFRER